MIALTLSDAKNIAIAVAAVFAVGSVASAWIMKTILQKVAVAAVLAVLAFAVWTQRTSLQDCADKVKNAYELDGVNPTLIDTDCSFFGVTITISDPRNNDEPDASE
ncbi:MAG: Na+-translocating ferredoxin:NAD+ oxidoreductase RnfA subunit [Ilumatobacter sp.]|jgi:Na+-translocating ferredoxin:NAD+ oxidoreductase RnfA subunit